MVNSPVGPLRADLGFRLTDVVPDQPRMVLHVSVGHPF
jgi:outer membrane translocation and assembly module TamA